MTRAQIAASVVGGNLAVFIIVIVAFPRRQALLESISITLAPTSARALPFFAARPRVGCVARGVEPRDAGGSDAVAGRERLELIPVAGRIAFEQVAGDS